MGLRSRTPPRTWLKSFDALNADTHIISIILTDAGIPALTLTVAQALDDTAALGKILGPYTIAISDTTADVSANHAALVALIADGRVTSITRTEITGQAYSSYEQLFNEGVFAGTNYFYTNIAGEPYSSYEYDYSPGADFIGSNFYYTNVTGKSYTGEEVDYNGAGQPTRADFPA